MLIQEPVKLVLETWETIDGQRITDSLLPFIEVFDLDTNTIYERQAEQGARAFEIEIIVELEAQEVKRFGIRLGKRDHRRRNYTSFVQGAEGVQDIDFPTKENELTIETSYYSCHLSSITGVIDIVDKMTQKNILRDNALVPFMYGVYENTPIKTTPGQERRRMGRNRKGKGVNRFISKLTDFQVEKSGEISRSVTLDFSLEGTQLYTVILKFYNELPLITTSVRIQKDNTWAPENLYISLPIQSISDLYAEKSGQIFRPAIDQLPGTSTDFYLVDSGMFYLDEQGNSVGILPKDTPLFVLGNLDPKLIELCSDKTAYKNKEQIFAWVMNNFWETNFKVDLSGFYEFEFDIYTSSSVQSLEQAHRQLRQHSVGAFSVITNEDK